MQWLNWLLFIVTALVFLSLFRLSKRAQKNPNSNPLSEADVYLAYGRKQEAIEVLKSALAADPDNSEIKQKLKEIQQSSC